MNRRIKTAAMLGMMVIGALTAVACAAPVENDDTLPDIADTTSFQQYTVPTTLPPPSPKKPTCCASTACCKEWCTYYREDCGNASSCWSEKTKCDNRCTNGHG